MAKDPPPVIILPNNNTTTNHVAVPLERLDSDLSTMSLGETEKNRFGAFANVALSWENLDVSATVDTATGLPCCRKGEKVKKQILSEVSGICKPGTFMAIMGASGAGKTTLLNTLARKNAVSLSESGSIRMNGVDATRKKMMHLSAYVQQEDYFIATMTVKEVLMFHANLRMGRDTPYGEKKRIVKKILNELGLTKVENTLCGAPAGLIRGISGGERKRLSVACELLMNPPLLFIDEPTSGLDSFMAQSIVRLIGKLAKANRTILCTIHQPTSEVFAMFDQLYLVANGRCAYSGPCKDALTFFRSVGHPCPENFNPADHYIFTLAMIPGQEEECREKVNMITDKFAASDEAKVVATTIEETRKEFQDSDMKISIRSAANIATQFTANLRRSWRNVIRNPAYTKIRIVQTLVLGLLGGLAYLNNDNDQEAFQDKSGFLFFIVSAMTFGNTFVQSQNLPMDLPIIKREYRNGMYGVISVMSSKVIIEMPYLFILTLLQWLVFWGLGGLRRTAVGFFSGYITVIGVSFVSTTMGYFVACVAGNAVIAAALTPLFILPYFLFGGLYQNEASTPYYFYPVKYLSWFRYGFGSLIINEFEDLELGCNNASSTPCVFTNGNEVLDYYNIDTGDIWFPNLVAMFIMGVGYLFLSIFILWLRIRQTDKGAEEKNCVTSC